MKFEENLSSIYENLVYCKRNIFPLPTGKSGRCFIDETTRLIDVWIIENITLKAEMIMPSFLLQNPSKDSTTY